MPFSSLCLLPTSRGRPCWAHACSSHGEPSLLETTYLLITDSQEIKRSVFGKGKNKAAGARCFMPMSFSSFSFQTMKFLWTLTRLWSHMDLALREPGWLLDQTLVFLNKVTGKTDVDFSLLLRNKVEQSNGGVCYQTQLLRHKRASKDAYKSHERKTANAIAFHPLLYYLVWNRKGMACIGWTLCNTSEAHTSISTAVMFSLLITRQSLRWKRLFFHIWNLSSRWPE